MSVLNETYRWLDDDGAAFGAPGLEPRWTSSRKDAVSTAYAASSRIWFTASHGTLNEIYYPRVDHACTRDLGFVVTDGQTYFSEEKRDARSETSQVARGVPAYQIRNTAVDGRYRIEKEVLTDPWRGLTQVTRDTLICAMAAAEIECDALGMEFWRPS